MSKPVLMSLFLALCVAQVAVPASMIIQLQTTSDKGTLYRFRTAPVDPYDPFRGRYVALSFEQTTVPLTPGQSVPNFKPVYVTLAVDEDGFAQLVAVELKPPTEGDYIKAKVRWSDYESATIDLPFDRYYMPEDDAPAAETAYRRRDQRTAPAYVEVSVYKGRAVLQGLYLDDIPVEEYLLLHPED